MTGTSTRGFASMDPMKQRQIASKGGKAAHIKGTAHQFTPEEARLAGSKGGRAARRRRQLSIVPDSVTSGNPTVNSVDNSAPRDFRSKTWSPSQESVKENSHSIDTLDSTGS